MSVSLYGSGQTAIQVAQTVLNTTFSTTSTTYTAITGLSVTITPQSTTSKILVIAQINGASTSSASNFGLSLYRAGSAIYNGAAGTGQQLASSMGYSVDTNTQMSNSIVYLDSPSTTSAITYQIYLVSNTGTAVYVNRSAADTASSTCYRTPSSITVIEISGS